MNFMTRIRSVFVVLTIALVSGSQHFTHADTPLNDAWQEAKNPTKCQDARTAEWYTSAEDSAWIDALTCVNNNKCTNDGETHIEEQDLVEFLEHLERRTYLNTADSGCQKVQQNFCNIMHPTCNACRSELAKLVLRHAQHAGMKERLHLGRCNLETVNCDKYFDVDEDHDSEQQNVDETNFVEGQDDSVGLVDAALVE